jgi:hypothetical protein
MKYLPMDIQQKQSINQYEKSYAQHLAQKQENIEIINLIKFVIYLIKLVIYLIKFVRD